MVRLSRLSLILAASISVISVPIACAFGLSLPLWGNGVSAFVDGVFIASEISNLLVACIGALAISRISLAIIVRFSSDASVWARASDASQSRKYALHILIGFAALLMFCGIAGPIIGRRLLLSFAFNLMFVIGFSLFVFAIPSPMEGTDNGRRDLSTETKSLIRTLQEPRVMYAATTFALLFSINLGYFRLLSLALSPSVCIFFEGGKAERASIVELTEHGIITATVKADDFFAITLPMGNPVMRSRVFSFASFKTIDSVKADCEL